MGVYALSQQAVEKKFGDYSLVERIAIGGMAEVWRARSYGSAGFEKTLVIKKILEKYSRDEEFVTLFVDEARIAVLLQHANIVQVFDLGVVDGSYFMAMEYVHGIDLGKLLDKLDGERQLPVHLALFIVSEVLKALRFAHERLDDDGSTLNIVHCDISPANLLISMAGEIKITDFGISRAAFQASELHETVRGKYAYMSPEQIENAPLDGRSDLFSLGVILWELLTGRRLFKGANRDETMEKARRAEVPSPRTYRPKMSVELDRFVLKALSREPKNRFRNAGQMLDELGNLMAREGHRASNLDMATYLTELGLGSQGARVVDRKTKEQVLVVVAAEAVALGPKQSGRTVVDEVTDAWTDTLTRAGAQIWEREGRSVLAVWPVRGDLPETMDRALGAVQQVRAAAREAGFIMAAGVCPGKAKLFPDSGRPGAGWELLGPFFMARWMMNLSAHRGRVVLTKAGVDALRRGPARQAGEVLGRLTVDGQKQIQLFAIG
ncbi:MAG: hypothetical protein RLZZ383_2654 [Pseudomonadota bacterium]|jgi:tRNA A-37 threonylcarbamoyl transferase component Bud32